MTAFDFIFRVVAIVSALSLTVSASIPEAIQILKRQDVNDTVGTNLYNCHDNCGEAILEEEVAGFCNSTIFSTDYASCLQCSGPDNEDIWQYYGPYLTAGALECGSATVPLTGTQADVATAMLAQNASTTSGQASATGGSTVAVSVSATTTASETGASSSASASASSTKSGASLQFQSASSKYIGGISMLVVLVTAGMV